MFHPYLEIEDKRDLLKGQRLGIGRSAQNQVIDQSPFSPLRSPKLRSSRSFLSKQFPGSRCLQVLVWLLAVISASAEDFQVWMSTKGTTMEARLLSVDEDNENVFLESKGAESKKRKLAIEDLSLGDRQYLVEHAGVDAEILKKGELTIPEEEVRVDTGAFEKLSEKMALDGGSTLVFDLMRTEHFLVATAGRIRPDAVGEIAELLWSGMASQHMGFRENWDGRMLIMLIEEDGVYDEVGEWYVKLLEKSGQEEQARRTQLFWERAGFMDFFLPSELAEEHEVFQDAAVFNVRMSGRYKEVFSPFPTHSIAGRILEHHLGLQGGKKIHGYFAITVGHAYYKEIQLAGKTVTHRLDADDYEGDEIAKARGFDDGTSWAKTLRKMVRRGDVVPKLESLMNIRDAMHLTPKQLVLVYSLACYMQSTPESLSAFAKMIREAKTTNSIPDSALMAEIFGFNSVEEMEKDWTEFIESRDFK